MDLTGQLEEVIKVIPQLLKSLGDYSPHLVVAVVVAAIVRWSIVPLIKAWKDDK